MWTMNQGPVFIPVDTSSIDLVALQVLRMCLTSFILKYFFKILNISFMLGVGYHEE